MIDLRSDTVTQPTPEMREAMARAAVGDDVFGEDPTVRELEELAAEMLGKDAGLFLPSGTMANLVAILAHTHRGDEVLVEEEAHTYYYEVGSMSAVAGVIPRPLRGRLGYISPEQVRQAVRPPNIHFPTPRLLCLENTHNRAGGIPFGPAEMAATCEAAREAGLRVHVDGARIFNAAVALGVSARTLVASADSAMFCVSKGLSAPVGSVLVGSRPFIEQARRYRKMLGGGMRQAGVIAAAGVVALRTMVDRLAEDHATARRLAEGLARVPGLAVDLERVRTNIVLVDVRPPATAVDLCERLRQHGVLALPTGPQVVRCVTHRHIGPADVDRAVEAAARAVAALAP
jgi:threonine aldolase